VRAALGEVDPLIPVAQLRTLREVVDEATAPTAFALIRIGLAAAIATLLGTVGVYAVVSYVVGGRTREIGVRMAMGARAGDVRRMVLRQGGTVILVGIAVGLAAAYLLTGLMSGLLYGVSPTDPVSYVAETTLMLAVAGLALWIPSRRAAGVDPLEALRSECLGTGRGGAPHPPRPGQRESGGIRPTGRPQRRFSRGIPGSRRVPPARYPASGTGDRGGLPRRTGRMPGAAGPRRARIRRRGPGRSRE